MRACILRLTARSILKSTTATINIATDCSRLTDSLAPLKARVLRQILTTCLLVISQALLASAQQDKRHASLTRAETREAEHRLNELGYWTGTVDGLFDPATRSALIAFQKWEGRRITGKLTLEELEAIRNSAAPKARDTGYEHVEVDIDRQVLMFINDQGEVRVLPVSTGSGKPFT